MNLLKRQTETVTTAPSVDDQLKATEQSLESREQSAEALKQQLAELQQRLAQENAAVQAERDRLRQLKATRDRQIAESQLDERLQNFRTKAERVNRCALDLIDALGDFRGSAEAIEAECKQIDWLRHSLKHQIELPPLNYLEESLPIVIHKPGDRSFRLLARRDAKQMVRDPRLIHLPVSNLLDGTEC